MPEKLCKVPVDKFITNSEKVMKKIVLALTLTLALPAVGQQVGDADCDEPQTQVEMNACAYLGFQTADAELNREWGSLRESIDRSRRNR